MRASEIIKRKTLEFVNKIKKVKKRTLYCVGIGIIFAVLSFFLNKKSIYVGPNEILRGSYGTQKTPYNVKVDAENLAKNIEFNISVSARRYDVEEAKDMFNKKLEQLMIDMLNGNEDYDHICEKLNFANDLGDGIKASYAFEPERVHKDDEEKLGTSSNIKDFKYYVTYQGLIDGSGNVKNEDFKVNEICTGYIEIQFSADIAGEEEPYKSEKILVPVKIVSKKLSPIESFRNSYIKAVNDYDKNSIVSPTLVLPNVVDDIRIRYKDERDLSFLLLPLFGILVAILLEAKDKEKVKEELRRRTRLLEIDFAQIISKVLLFVSSGMTIRNSFIRLADQYLALKSYYEKKYENNKKKKFENRVAYEELVIIKNKLTSGYSEIRAYEEMAKNINMRSYTRFLNIIIQSIMNGNKELKNILNMEVQDALYERKQHAKKLGEEAATKLVLPLMIMLAVIMIVIMVPAFMGM